MVLRPSVVTTERTENYPDPFSFHTRRVVTRLEAAEGNFHSIMELGCRLLPTLPPLEKMTSEDSMVYMSGSWG